MFEQDVSDVLVGLAAGYLSFVYAEKFLQKKFDDRRRAAIIWSVIYAAEQVAVSNLSSALSPYDRFIIVLPQILILLLLQKIFFAPDRARQIFITASFLAGWEILRFIISPLSYLIFGIWSPIWVWGVTKLSEMYPTSTDEIIYRMTLVNRAAIFVVLGFCRVVQLGILFYFLRMIERQFTRRDYDLNFRDTLFLLFPCVTVLAIDLTMRLTAFSSDGGLSILIYDREPATLFLLPAVSILLLGVIISSVMLFQNLVKYRDEERKRILLENGIKEVHREIEELNEIYSDIRGLRHDLRNHVANLAAYVRKISPGENPEAENYLRRMTDTLDRLNFSDKTGNPVTDMIIHQTRQRAKRKEIIFESDFHCPKNPEIDVYDIGIILNNALQNALEACEKISGEREIKIRSFMKGNLFFIEVENNFGGELNFDTETNIPATTKSEKKLHGIGLANVRRSAQKYSGDIEIEILSGRRGKIFRLTVMLYKKIF